MICFKLCSVFLWFYIQILLPSEVLTLPLLSMCPNYGLFSGNSSADYMCCLDLYKCPIPVNSSLVDQNFIQDWRAKRTSRATTDIDKIRNELLASQSGRDSNPFAINLCDVQTKVLQPVYGTKMTGEPTQILQIPVVFIQNVVLNTCISKETKIIRGNCVQEYKAEELYALSTSGTGSGEIIVGKEFFWVEAGCRANFDFGPLISRNEPSKSGHGLGPGDDSKLSKPTIEIQSDAYSSLLKLPSLPKTWPVENVLPAQHSSTIAQKIDNSDKPSVTGKDFLPGKPKDTDFTTTTISETIRNLGKQKVKQVDDVQKQPLPFFSGDVTPQIESRKSSSEKKTTWASGLEKYNISIPEKVAEVLKHNEIESSQALTNDEIEASKLEIVTSEGTTNAEIEEDYLNTQKEFSKFIKDGSSSSSLDGGNNSRNKQSVDEQSNFETGGRGTAEISLAGENKLDEFRGTTPRDNQDRIDGDRDRSGRIGDKNLQGVSDKIGLPIFIYTYEFDPVKNLLSKLNLE